MSFLNFGFAGYVLSLLWGWIVVIIFHLPQISVVQGIGIVVMVSFLTFHRPALTELKAEFKWGDMFCVEGYNFLTSVSFLFFGWVIHQLIQ